MRKIILAVLIGAWMGFACGAALGAPRDTVVIAQGVDATTLDPHNHYEMPNFNVCLNIYETLFMRDDEMKLQPLLATSSRLINDTTWEFGLRKGVKFQNGEIFNAAAVKYSLERLSDPKAKLKQTTLQGVISKVEIVDDYTVRVYTSKPYPYLDSQLGHLGAILPPKYAQEKGMVHLARNPVGTGPYKLVSWIKDDHLVLEANDGYWKGPPRIKKGIFRPIPEPTTRVAGLQTQELDLIVNIPPHLSRLMDWKGRSRIAKVPSARIIYMALDTTKEGPTSDRRVRQAIAQGIDLDTIIRTVLEGNALKQGAPVTPSHFAYDPAIKPYAYNPENARKLLAEAGLAKGFDMVINSPNGRYLNDKEMAEAVAGSLRKVGISASVKPYEWGTYLNQIYSRKGGPAFIMGSGGATFDPDANYFPHLKSGQIYSHYNNPKMDELIEQGRITMDKGKRAKIYGEAARLYKEDAPWAFCYQQMDIYGASERLNWKPRPDEKIVLFNMSFKN